MGKKTGRTAPQPWEPFTERQLKPNPMPAAMAHLDDQHTWRMWQNNLYAVLTRTERTGWVADEFPDGVPVLHMSIRRLDRKTIRNWRHLQRIKSEIAGNDVEALEIYPAESRLMDAANSYHLYCLPAGMKLPMGEWGRAVADEGDFRQAILDAGGSQEDADRFRGKQEPWEYDKDVTLNAPGLLRGWENDPQIAS